MAKDTGAMSEGCMFVFVGLKKHIRRIRFDKKYHCLKAGSTYDPSLMNQSIEHFR